ncbi:MAG: hypothetical protein KAT39_13795 [Alphaproteobacteria bacterium]|nr:hypothetical protein [Alphaproteobacteria bacterium]
MDFRLLRRLIAEKLHDRSTYIVAAIVGTLINAYGQLLVPWFRGAGDPFVTLSKELDINPGLTLFSIFLAYAFPLCVGIYSSVATRYKTRRFESVADFPDRKPDPVFRAAPNGRIVELGDATRVLFERYEIESAQAILGEEVWRDIVSKRVSACGRRIFFEPEDASYVLSHAPTSNEEINIYLTRLPV